MPTVLSDVDQSTLAPRERTDTLPSGLPDLTLGWGAIAWIHDNLVHAEGDRANLAFRLTERQVRFLLWFYALDEDGQWLHISGVRRLAKGSGKSPFAAVHALLELLGPVRLDHFDPSAPGGCVGTPVAMPLVQIAATSERQTANTMRMIRAMTNRRTSVARRYKLDVGKTYVDTPTGGRLEQIASSAGSAEGAIVTFAIADETEHWLPGQGGPQLMGTLRRNAIKSGSRVVETSNAWRPGKGSVAESTYDAWVEQQEGKSIATQTILYDARIAPANTALTDDPEPGQISLTEGLAYVYEDCYWVPQEAIKQQIWQADTVVADARGFYLNQPTASDTSWVTPQQWGQLVDHDRVVADGEEIVMFLDPSRESDHSALIGCCMEDGHVFTLGVWDPELPEHKGRMAEILDGAVREVRERFTVVAFWSDVHPFDGFVKTTWPALFADDELVPVKQGGHGEDLIAWDMRVRRQAFATAAELVHSEIIERTFTHDGNADLSRHVNNARVKERNGHYAIGKESPKSPHKVDAAVAMIGARLAYHAAHESPIYLSRRDTAAWSLY